MKQFYITLIRALDGDDESLYRLMIKHGKHFPHSPVNKYWRGNDEQLRYYLRTLAEDIQWYEEAQHDEAR